MIMLSHRLDRLHYLVRTGRDSGIDWRDAVTMPDVDWNEMYAGYAGWWKQKSR